MKSHHQSQAALSDTKSLKNALPKLIVKFEEEARNLILARYQSGHLINYDVLSSSLASEALAARLGVKASDIVGGYTNSKHFSVFNSGVDSINPEERRLINYTYRLSPGHKASEMLFDLFEAKDHLTLLGGIAPATLIFYYVMSRIFAHYFPTLDSKNYFDTFFSKKNAEMLISSQAPTTGNRYDCQSGAGFVMPYNPINFFLDEVKNSAASKGDIRYFSNTSSSVARNKNFKGVTGRLLICIQDEGTPLYMGLNDDLPVCDEAELKKRAIQQFTMKEKQKSSLIIKGFNTQLRLNIAEIARCIQMPQSAMRKALCITLLELQAIQTLRKPAGNQHFFNLNAIQKIDDIEHLTALIQESYQAGLNAYFDNNFNEAINKLNISLMHTIFAYHYYQHRVHYQRVDEQEEILLNLHKQIAYACHNVAAALVAKEVFEEAVGYLQEAHQIFMACFADEPETIHISQSNLDQVTRWQKQEKAKAEKAKAPQTKIFSDSTNSSTLYSKNKAKKDRRKCMQESKAEKATEITSVLLP